MVADEDECMLMYVHVNVYISKRCLFHHASNTLVHPVYYSVFVVPYSFELFKYSVLEGFLKQCQHCI